MILTTPAISFVWGSSVPLPPDLAPGWCYHPDDNYWLMVERLSDGSLWYVVCEGADYFLWPRVTVPRGPVREYMADRDAKIPLPALALIGGAK